MTGPVAAWIPEHRRQDPEAAARAAVDWVEEQSRHLRVEAVLLTATKDDASYAPSLELFAARHGHATLRTPSVRRPVVVLACLPDLKLLDMSMRLSQVTAVCVIEWPMTPVAGWAAQLSAKDLTQPEASTPDIPTDLAEAIERLVHYGNNGYAGRFQRPIATRLLRDLHGSGWCDPDWLAAAVVAKGISARGAERLRGLARKTAGTERQTVGLPWRQP